MHLPDGILSTPACVATNLVAAGALGAAAWHVARSKDRPTVAACGLTGAVLLAMQAVNFPLTADVSGHLLGSVLACAVLGPAAGMLVVAAVLAIQAVCLGDGGLTVLGANLLNMAVLPAVVSYVCGVRGVNRSSALRGGLAAAVAVPAAALLCGAQVAWLGADGDPLTTFTHLASTMLPLHLLLAVAEGCFTAAAILLTIRREGATLANGQPGPSRRRYVLAYVTVAIATAVALPHSAPQPDTLEHALAQFAPSSTAARR